MLLSYFKIGFRNLWKNKTFSVINLLGLSIGMAAAILILLWIQHEINFDKFYSDQERIYQVLNKSEFDGKLRVWKATPKILGKTLKADYPEVEYMTRVDDANMLLRTNDNNFNASGCFADPDFLKIFDFKLKWGNIDKVLDGSYSIVITQSLASKLFGSEDPMGKTIQLNPGNGFTGFTVTGVLRDLPDNSQFNFEYLIPWLYMKQLGWDDNYWGNNSVHSFVKLRPGVNIAAFNEKIKNITIDHTNHEEDNIVIIHPLSRRHLYGNFENGVEAGGRITLVRLFAVIAGLILLIACINFMNLSTARSEKRAREVGIRKVVGAQKSSLVAQFLGESILLTIISGLAALLLVQLVLPSFNTLVTKKLEIPYTDINFWIAGIGFILFTGLLAGSYPAFYLSAFRPIRVLKGTVHKVQGIITPRKLLVITQFTIAIVLIASTIIIRQQIRYAQERDAGYNKSDLGYVYLNDDIEKNYEFICQSLINSGAVTSISKTSAPVTQDWSNSWGIEWEGKDNNAKIVLSRFCSDGNLVKTAGLTIVKGRDINLKEFPGDSLSALINESAASVMGFKDPIGKTFQDMSKTWTIVGVVKDMILSDPYAPKVPMIIEGPAGWFNVIHFRLNPNHTATANLNNMEAVFKKYNPEFPFIFKFVDSEYERKFNDEKRIATLASLFAGLTIFISCLGLFALATYMAANRVKEIGVRKVLGASVFDITALLSKDFLTLVFISIIIATPLAWWAMYNWLQDFNYRISIRWWVFLLAGAGAVLIALITVSFNSIRAAMAKPTKNLRSE